MFVRFVNLEKLSNLFHVLLDSKHSYCRQIFQIQVKDLFGCSSSGTSWPSFSRRFWFPLASPSLALLVLAFALNLFLLLSAVAFLNQIFDESDLWYQSSGWSSRIPGGFSWLLTAEESYGIRICKWYLHLVKHVFCIIYDNGWVLSRSKSQQNWANCSSGLDLDVTTDCCHAHIRSSDTELNTKLLFLLHVLGETCHRTTFFYFSDLRLLQGLLCTVLTLG